MLSFLYHYGENARNSITNQQQQPQAQQQRKASNMKMAQGGNLTVAGTGLRQHPGRTKVNWGEVTLRRRLVADCQIIVCILLSGFTIVLAGTAMLLSAKLLMLDESPFLLIGPVLIGCGVVVLLLSVETCVRRSRVAKQADDLSSDEEDSSRIDEGLVNYGYGNFKSESQKRNSQSPIFVKSTEEPVVAMETSEPYVPSFKVEGRRSEEDNPRMVVELASPISQHQEASPPEQIEMLTVRADRAIAVPDYRA